MEPERVEMSVGGALVNGNHAVNGDGPNGAVVAAKSATDRAQDKNGDVIASTNGVAGQEVPQNGRDSLQEDPEDALNKISTDFYLPVPKLVNRSAQECWNDLTDMVERLARLPVFAQVTAAGTPQINDQSKANLDKKDALLTFANKHKAVFIKLLVLLQWSKRGEDVRKTIELNYWLVQRRTAYIEATLLVGQMMQDLATSQIPNPDLYTAAQVLSTGKVLALPDLDCLPKPTTTPKQALRVLRRLNNILCTRLALDIEVPYRMRDYHVHDGRVTFSVTSEFEVDLSLTDDTNHFKLWMVGFRFRFSPRPQITDSFQDEISYIVNSEIDQHGLAGVYDFLHDLTLSCKLSELHAQAQQLSQGLWAGHLKTELLRRTLVVQYWLKQSGPRSWLEIGIHSGKRTESHERPDHATPRLQVRWLREDKQVQVEELNIDESILSFEQILRQVLARHINVLFGSIFDKLLLSPLYAGGELELDQISSLEDPASCNLSVQLSKTDHLRACIEPVSGAVVLSPVSDKSNKVQTELSRSKNLVEDFVSKILGLRCAIAESKLLRAMSNSEWQYLPGLRLNPAENENLFSQPVMRSNFYRLAHWSRGWMLAITQSASGDHWWLTRHQHNEQTLPRLTQRIQSRPLHLEGSLTPAYLDRLAEYTSGVIILQSNTEFLSKHKIPYRLSAIPRFGDRCRMPPLRFDLPSKGTSEFGRRSCIGKEVELRYRGADESAQNAIIIARASFIAAAVNLKELAALRWDDSVSISVFQKQVMVRNLSATGSTVVESIVSKLKHVDDIVACAATVKRSTSHSLRSLSLSSFSVCYKSKDEVRYELLINLATAERGLHIDFLPAGQNPHKHMSIFVTQLLTRRQQSLSKNLEEVLALLRMTWPLMLYFYDIQRWNRPPTPPADNSGANDLLRVHILPRQAASYAIHYFSKSANFPSDVTDTETPRKLLVRLEIFPKHRGQKTLWVIRPAIEEFSGETRPSFTSKDLRRKIQTDIFRKENPDWLRLDDGAAVSSEKPEILLSKVHDCIKEWLAEVIKSDVKVEAQQTNGIKKGSNAGTNNQLKTPVESQKTPLSAGARQQNRSGASTQGQRSNHNFSQNLHQPEVITLD